MAKLVSVHSFRGGTGKSNTVANLAALAAADGLRVAVVDLDVLSPGIHALFGLRQDALQRSLNDYLWGKCEIEDAAHDVTPLNGSGHDPPGRIVLVPSSIDPADIARVVHDGYDVGELTDGLRRLIESLSLDLLLLDTHPGLHEETLLSIAMSEVLVIVMRPDKQDYEGTHVTVSVARRLKVPRMLLVVNKTPATFDPGEVAARVEEAYGCDVAAVLPHSDELMALSSEGLFALRYPDHPVAHAYKLLARRILE